jgi:hypothetical protein
VKLKTFWLFVLRHVDVTHRYAGDTMLISIEGTVYKRNSARKATSLALFVSSNHSYHVVGRVC